MYLADWINMPPEPTVGSQIRMPSSGSSSSTISFTTMLGV